MRNMTGIEITGSWLTVNNRIVYRDYPIELLNGVIVVINTFMRFFYLFSRASSLRLME